MFHEILTALEETLFMVFSAGLVTWIVGLSLGILLAVTQPTKMLANKLIYRPLEIGLKAANSVPYIALMITLIPFTQWLTDGKEGCSAAILPLSLAAIPYFSDITEKAISNLPLGFIETAESLGASQFQIISKILLPEALPNIVKGLSGTLTHLLGYSTIAGALGCGGLGSLLIHKGYYFFHVEYVLTTLLIMIVLTHLIKVCGNYIAHGGVHANSH
jgi:D-methionine transport system permease protein